MKVLILKRSHSKVNFVRKDFLEMETVINMSIHLPEENHSNVLDKHKHKQGYNEKSSSNFNFVKKGFLKVET